MFRICPAVLHSAITGEAAASHIREAISGHLAMMLERGEPIPEATSIGAEMIDVPF